MGTQALICCVLLSLAAAVRTAEGGCFDQTDCRSCTEHSYYFVSCSWCPLSSTCHTFGSAWNICDPQTSISRKRKCPVEESQPYNQTFASQMAEWAALSYVKPKNIDSQVLQRVLDNELPGQYRVLKFIEKNCDQLVSYSACSLLVAISDVEKNIVVSFEGTQSSDQMLEQLVSVAINSKVESSIGGEVLYYNYNVHQLLYQCMKEFLIDVLYYNPYYRLTLTGHSLGGAQAQLAAATLVKDRVISTSRLAVYSFGAPRFGDSVFAERFDELVKTNWRLVQANDPIPRIPPYFLYHTHGEVWFNESGITTNSSYRICSVNEDFECALSQISVPCFSSECIAIHNEYFVEDIAREFGRRRLAGRNKAPRSTSGTCGSVEFSRDY